MAASDPHLGSDRLLDEETAYLSAEQLEERLEEEVGRAERHGTALSCLLVVIDGLEQMAGLHGSELPERMLDYVSGALRRELRRFDRVGRTGEHELALILPGADGARGELVARRVLDRLSTIKLESEGARHPLRVSLGLALWREQSSAAELIARARAATRVANGDNGNALSGPARR